MTWLNQPTGIAATLLLVAGGACASRVAAGSPPDGPTERLYPVQSETDDSFWPKPELLAELFRSRAADAAREYELSAEQQKLLEVQLLEHWPPFLETLRGELQPLLDQSVKTWYAETPPSEEAVRAWAVRSRPLFQQFRVHLVEANDRFAAILTPAQQAKFESKSVKLASQLDEFASRLDACEKGQFAIADWWGRQSREIRPPLAGQNPKAASQPADEIEAELAAWDEFVRSFCGQYDLDNAQRAAALSILNEVKERARNYRRVHRGRIAAVELLIGIPGPEADPKFVEAQLQELYGPIDEIFRELEQRLRRLPTESQKRGAGGANMPATSPATP